MPELMGPGPITSLPPPTITGIARFGDRHHPPHFHARPGRLALVAVGLAFLLAWGGEGKAGPSVLPQRFHQDDEQLPSFRGLIGTSIGDVVWSGHFLWVATENGVARLDPSQATGLDAGDWVTFTDIHGLGRGSVSALAAAGDTVWVGTLVDTVAAGIDTPPKQVGTGLSFSVDAGSTWVHLPNGAIFNPLVAGFEGEPSTAIDNAAFGLAIDGTTIWGAFFAGSSVRSRDAGQTWERVLPDGADDIVYVEGRNAADDLRILADSLFQAGADSALVAAARAGADSLAVQHLMHRTFDVLAYSDTVWIGTSSGIARSFDGGATWRNLKVRLAAGDSVLSGNIGGNWVVGIERQQLPGGGAVIWAGAKTSEGRGQVNSINFSSDDGDTWEFAGPPFAFAWNFAFTDNFVWAGGDSLLSSADGGGTWERVPVEDPQSRVTLRGTVAGLATAPSPEGGTTLWVGSDNGLARSEDEGKTWRVLSFLLKTRSVDTGKVIGKSGLADSVVTYAAPSPFAPSHGEITWVVYSLAAEADVTIVIYDFASRRVRTLIDGEDRRGKENHREPWDGLDDDGGPVANGVYFYRLEIGRGQPAFGKVVVLD